MRCVAIAVSALVLAVVSATAPVAQETPGAPPATDELIAREKVRSAVESIFDSYLQPAADGDERIDMAIRAARSFVEVGPEAVPYLANELEQERRETFDLCSYALGLIGTPEAARALQAAIERAEEEATDAARTHKAWATWGLGLLGEIEAVHIATEGRHQVANYPMHGKTSTMEALALQNGSRSVPPMLEVLEEVAHDDERWQVRRSVLRGLRRVGDPAAVPALLALLEHADRNVRREVAWTLRTMPGAEARDGIARALSDDDFTVRRTAALALEYAGAESHRERVLERLEVEEDPVARGPLYRALAESGGENLYERLTAHRGLRDPTDRRQLVEAVGLLDDPRRLSFLAGSLHDEDNSVALQAALSLGNIGNAEAAAALTHALPEVRPGVARTIGEQLARLRHVPAGEAITARIVSELAVGPPLERSVEIAVDKLADTLVELRYTPAARELLRAIEGREEPTVTDKIRRTVTLLELLRKNGRKSSRWAETARSEERLDRQLAYARLGEIGSAEAVEALEEAFEDADREDRVAILRALGDVRESRARPLIERVQLSDEFDHIHDAALRDMAAWSARRIGGEAMWELLQQAVRRREGRDAKVLIYAALVGGERALPLLAELRRPRMRYIGWPRGIEQERLDWLATRLATGRSVHIVDVPPQKLFFR